MPKNKTPGKAGLFLILIALFAFPANAFAQENIAELKLESITTPIRAGDELEFSFLVGNRAGPACSAQIEYWLERTEERRMKGSDVIYLAEKESKLETTSLMLKSDLEGEWIFYLLMQCNDTSALASRTINIYTSLPILPLIKDTFFSEINGSKAVEFSYVLESGYDYTVPVYLQGHIIQDNNIIWSNIQKVAVDGAREIRIVGPVLQAGTYELLIEARSGTEFKKRSRTDTP